MCFNGADLLAEHGAQEGRTVPDDSIPAASPDIDAPGRRLSRVPILLAVVVVALAGAGALAVSRSASPATQVTAAPHFIDEAAAAGLVHAYAGDYPYVVGGGVATIDCDEDGRPDLFIAGGESPAALFRNVSPVGGALRFEPVPAAATDLTSVTGAYPLDIDGDGLVDLSVLRLGENVILRGLGDCRFERANAALGLDGGDGWTVAFSATWEDETSLPTLAFGNYLGLNPDGTETDACAPGALVRPGSDGTTYAPEVPLTPGWCSLSMLFSDWDRSGRRDLRVSNDRHYYRDGEEQLWRIEAGRPPRPYTREEGWARLRVWGMGIASQDLTGDGYPEVYLTSQGDNKLQTLADGPDRPTYEDIALRKGAIAYTPYAGDEGLPSTAWHPEFADVNNDGYMDLFVSKGNVGTEVDHAMRDPSNLLIGQADGTFVEGGEAAGIVRFELARGAAVADLNLDGLLDLVQVTRNANVELWRNVGSGDAAFPGPMGHWVALDLDQDGANRDAIGAWVATRIGDRIVQREVTVGGGHASGELGWIHVGIGSAMAVEVRVTWPDGEMGLWQTVQADTFAHIVRGATDPIPWSP